MLRYYRIRYRIFYADFIALLAMSCCTACGRHIRLLNVVVLRFGLSTVFRCFSIHTLYTVYTGVLCVCVCMYASTEHWVQNNWSFYNFYYEQLQKSKTLIKNFKSECLLFLLSRDMFVVYAFSTKPQHLFKLNYYCSNEIVMNAP